MQTSLSLINDEYKYRVRVSFEKNKRLGYVKTKSMFIKYKNAAK
ncbi:hypothetical protein VCRA2116O426_30006 [Vibrio crassostreae]|nr:hypothetical protein VCRA2116O426_30006 [Vibrio crassostreae]